MLGYLFSAQNVSPNLWIVESVLVCVLGLVFGSFASAIAHRVPLSQPWAHSSSRSKCTSCGAVLCARDLIPLLSWLMNKGRCRHCGVGVSALYPVLEILSAALCLLVFLFYQDRPLEGYIFMLCIPFLLALTLIDLRHKILPNQLIMITFVLGVLFVIAKLYAGAAVVSVLQSHIMGALIFTGLSLFLGWFMKMMLKKDALGMGDVKFFAVAGLWLGLPYLGIFCILSGVLGVALGVVWKIRGTGAVFPFGPALITSFFLILLLDGSFLLEKTLQYF